MGISEIHIDEYGCWQFVDIGPIRSGLTLVHLDDGARPIDFARFLNGVLFGFDGSRHTRSSGHIALRRGNETWRLSRTCDGPGSDSWQLFRGQRAVTNGEIILPGIVGRESREFNEHLIIPTQRISQRWEWLARNSQIAHRLLNRRPPIQERLLRASNLSLSTHGDVLERLGEQRERLVTEIARRKQIRILPESVSEPPPLADEILIAELTDELRVFQRQIKTLTTAADLADRWAELQERKQLKRTPEEPERLQETLDEFLALEAEKSQLNNVPARSSGNASKHQQTQRTNIRRLLRQRDWVLKCIEQPPESRLDSPIEHEEILHAARLVDSARRESERAERRLSEFSERTAFDWSSLIPPQLSSSRREISADSPLAAESDERQLAELKRRRIWIREEHQCLLQRQHLTTGALVSIALLAVISLAALLGPLVVASWAMQWTLVAFGLCGLVASGAIKLSIDLRSSRMLLRAKDRLAQIDNEILTLTERVLAEQQDESAARRHAEQKMFAFQLQQAAATASRRLDGAESSFRNLLGFHGLPTSLGPEDIDVALRRTGTPNQSHRRSHNENRKLRRWIKRSRQILEQVEGTRPNKDPATLLTLLERTLNRLRDGASLDRNAKPSQRRRSRDGVRRELKRIEKRQRLLLRNAKVQDRCELQAAITSAQQAEMNRHRVRTLERELAVAIESSDDPDEIRELLEMFDAAELRRRLSDRQQQSDETERALVDQQKVKPRDSLTRVSYVEPTDLDKALLQLGVVDTRIRQTMKSARTNAVFHKIVRTINQNRPEHSSSRHLPLLSDGRWESILDTRQGFVLTSRSGERVPVEASTEISNLAWLSLQLDAAVRADCNLPLVLQIDWLFDTPLANNVLACLQQAATSGLQILLLAGKRQLVNQIGETVPVVRIRLRPQRIPYSRVTRAHQDPLTVPGRRAIQ